MKRFDVTEQLALKEPALAYPRPAREHRGRRAVERDEINLADVATVLKREKWLILALTLGIGLAAGLGSLLLTKRYEATVELSPVLEDPGGGHLGAMGSGLAQLSGLASLAGFGSSGTRRAESLATLQSQAVSKEFVQAHNLLPILYPKLWDPAHHTWKPTDPRERPTLWKASMLLRKRIVKVTDNAKTGIVTLTVTWTDPAVAAAWANGIVDLANSYLKSKAIAESERNIDYLKQQVAATNDLDLRKTIYSLMEQEIKKGMVARGSDEYALKVLDPASAPELASSPQPLLYGLGGAFIGMFISFLVLTFRKPRPAQRSGKRQ